MWVTNGQRRCFFFSSRRRHTRCSRDWSSDVCSSDLFFKGYRLKNPVQVPVDRILAAGEVGLCEYIFRSLIPTRPRLIPWVLENRTLIELASYLLRARSRSKMGFYGSVNTLGLYCGRLNTSPDQLISDIVSYGFPHLARIDKHRAFLHNCLNETYDTCQYARKIAGYTANMPTL